MVFKRLDVAVTTGYHHLGAGSDDTSAFEISQAHPADPLNITKFIYILRNNYRIENFDRKRKEYNFFELF